MLRPLDIIKDIQVLVDLEKLTQISPWMPEVFYKCLEAGSKAWVIEVKGVVIAFLLVLFQAGEGHILNICVHPAYQRQGYGAQLILKALQAGQALGHRFIFLEVRRSNSQAIKLYEKLGFKSIGERKGYYASTQDFGKEDALVFAKHLQSE